MTFLHRFALFSLFIALQSGCYSYDIVQSNIFSDDDGNIVQIDYGRSERDHTNTFIAPTTGQEMEFKSKLLVKVHLPDGDSFKAWQCMNFQRSGTMYKTDDKEWMILVNGFTTFVYRLEEPTGRYLEVYRGILCQSPETKYKANEKWRKMKKGDRGKEDWR